MDKQDRDTTRYVLREGHEVVAYGVSDDPEARLQEHQRNHPRITMTEVRPAVTRESALAWELLRLSSTAAPTLGKDQIQQGLARVPHASFLRVGLLTLSLAMVILGGQ
jgi:hypothetical protein